MAWTEISTATQICEQQPGYAYGVFTASGSVYKGQGVYIPSSQLVKAGAPGESVIGVAANDASDGNEVAVYGPGCIVNTQISGNVTAGSEVGCNANGAWHNSGNCYKAGIVVKQGGSSGVNEGQVLILGASAIPSSTTG